MSYFSYGAPAGSTDPTQGIVISYTTLEGMDDLPIMSDDGTEYLYTERTISVRGVMNGGLLPAVPGETPSQTLNRVRHILKTPRLQLFFYHNNPSTDSVPLCQSPAAGVGVDVRFGPITKNVKVYKIAGSECLMVQMQVTTWVLECVGTRPYTSHRWTESVKIGQDFLSTKVRQGKIFVRADAGVSPDSLRGLVAPPLDPGFRRIGAEYIMQSDGLALQYTFTDEEQYIQAPLGAIDADGQYTESATLGSAREGECWVRLKGPKVGPFSDKANLLQTAIQIVMQKLDLGGLKRGNEPLALLYGGVRESLWKNEVEVRMRVIIEPLKTSKTKGVAVDLSRFNAPLLGVDYQSQAPGVDLGTRGSAQLTLIANALNDPCLGETVSAGQSVLTAGTGALTDLNVLSASPPATIFLTAVLPDDAGDYDSTDPQGPYSEFQMRTRYEPDTQTVVLATAKSGAPAAAVQLGEQTMTAIVEWSAERYASVPQIPPTDTGDPNAIFLRSEFNPEEVELAADGTTPIYKLSGRYYYSYLDQSKAQLNFPTPSYMDPGVAATLTAIPSSMFTQRPSPLQQTGQNILKTGPLPS